MLHPTVLKTKQVFLMLVISTGLLNHVMIIPTILQAAGRDSWFSIAAVTPLFVLYMTMVFFIVKKTGQANLYDWCKKSFGKAAALFIVLPIVFIAFTVSYISLKDTSIWLTTYFLVDMPSPVIIFVLTFICFWATKKGIKAMAIMTTVILPIVVVLGFFIMFVNSTEKDMELLFPLFSEGYRPFMKGMIYAAAGLMEIFVILLIQQHVHDQIRYKHVLLLGFVFIGLMSGPLSAAIMEYGPVEAENLRYPAYEQWRLLRIGDFISQIDFLAMYQWMSGFIIRVSLFMFIVHEFLNQKKQKWLLPFLYFLLLALSLYPVNTHQFYNALYRFFFPFFVTFILFMTIIIFILAVIASKRSHKNDNKDHQKATT
ncbi:spore germination protein (amino acid permease) [Bacillus fengqiuensis]|nr:spore germination protein (amino acid permease) [Bacillus fengqiuensis]